MEVSSVLKGGKSDRCMGVSNTLNGGKSRVSRTVVWE